MSSSCLFTRLEVIHLNTISASSALGESHQLDSALRLTHVETCHDSESLSGELGPKKTADEKFTASLAFCKELAIR